MGRERLWLAASLGALFLSGHAAHAEAKVIEMGTLSRQAVQEACARAGGQPFGIDDDTVAYGCTTAVAQVACGLDSSCEAQVDDTTPVVGNSLDYILSIAQPAIGPSIIAPISGQVTRLNNNIGQTQRVHSDVVPSGGTLPQP